MKFRVFDGEKMYYLKDGFHIVLYDDPHKVEWALYSNDDDRLITKADRGGVLLMDTGLWDMNNNKIWEGDIVFDEGTKTHREIVWLDNGAQFIMVDMDEDREWDILSEYDKIYVKGNVFEPCSDMM